MPIAVALGAAIVAVLALIILYGLGLVTRMIAALVQDWPWPFDHIVGWVIGYEEKWLSLLEHAILGALHPIFMFIEGHSQGIATFIAGLIDYLFHLDDKTNSVHRTAEAAAAAAAAAQKTAGKAASVARVEQIIRPTYLLAHQTAANLANYERYVERRVVPAIDQTILREERKAIARAEAYTTAAIGALDEVYHRRLRELVPAGTAIPGYALDTIPIALAGTIAALLPLVAEAETCWNPMCADWNLAKDVLESALSGLAAAGVVAALAEMVTNPAAAAKVVAGAAGDVGGSAEALWESLGIPLSPESGT